METGHVPLLSGSKMWPVVENQEKLLQRMGCFVETLKRFCRFFWRQRIREAHPVLARVGKVNAGDNGDSEILGDIAAKGFGIFHATARQRIRTVDKGIIARLTDDVLVAFVFEELAHDLST